MGHPASPQDEDSTAGGVNQNPFDAGCLLPTSRKEREKWGTPIIYDAGEVGHPPSFAPTSGPVGTQVTIAGAGFTGATKVTFGGVKATAFTVNSATQVTATVPVGAKTGKIAVTTLGGTASKGIFTVS